MTDKHKFLRREAMVRARFEYGIHPHEPERPCKILSGSVTYRCECGYYTASARGMWDHVHAAHAIPNSNSNSDGQLDLFAG